MVVDNWILPLAAIFLLGLTLNLPVLSILSAAMSLLLWIASYWSRHALDGLEYARRLKYTRGFPGEEIEVRIEVRNQKPLPMLWLIAADLWPRPVAPINEDQVMDSHMPGMARLVNIFRMPPFGQYRRKFRLRLGKRGVYPLGPVRLESGDPFGLYTASKDVGSVDRITVYPELSSLPQIELPSASPFGERRIRRRLFEDPSRPMGVRDYQITDEFRRVHWPATARTGVMQSKVYEPTAERVMVICLNTATSERHWEGVYPDLLEHLVRTSAAIAQQATQAGYQVGLVSNGTMSKSDQPYRILPGRSGRQLSYLFTALAGVTPLVGLPFHRYLLRELPKLPYGIVMAVITAVVNDVLLETLVEAKRHGRKILLISLADDSPPHCPRDSKSAFALPILIPRGEARLMSAVEGGILRWLGLPSRTWRAWREVSLLAVLFLELSWIAPWMHALLQGESLATPFSVARTLSFAALVTYLLARAGGALSLKRNIRQTILVLVLILAIPGSLATIIYPGKELRLGEIISRFVSAIQVGESLVPNEFLVALTLLWVWTRSIRWASADGLPSEMISRFKIGFLFLVAYVIAFTRIGEGDLSFFIYTFFFFALLAMGSARLARSESQAAAGGRFYSPRLLLTFLSAFTVFVFFLAFLGVGIRAQFAFIQQAALYLWLLFWGAVILLLSPFIVAISLIFEWLMKQIDFSAVRVQPITNFFEEPSENPELLIIENPVLQGIFDSLNLSALFAVLRPLLLWGALVLILVLGLYYAGRRIGFWKALRGNISREETVIQSDDWWKTIMAAWRNRLKNLRDGLARFVDLRQGRRLLAAARIRRVYTFLMDLSAVLGSPRKEAQTPLEYIPTLIAIFPHHTAELQIISRAYMRVRYGELDETPRDVIEVDRAWLQIRLEGEHIKKKRRKEKQEKKKNNLNPLQKP